MPRPPHLLSPQLPSRPLRAQVFGAGPTGALAALAMAQAGWRVRLCDPLSADQLRSRSRAYALTHSSRRLLQGLGLWDGLTPHLVPFRQLELWDRALHQHVRFSAADRGTASAAVGWILQHGPLMELLLQALSSESAIELALGEVGANGQGEPAPQLLVAADGHHSPQRRAARICQLRRPYRQGCLTVQVALRGSAADQAWELFRPEGPFAVLPLGGERFQLVWSAPLQRLQQLERLEPVAFLEALSAALPEPLQAEVLLDQPRAFPVAWELAWPLQRGPLVLLGEAAHRCHPVGGQGLNLCWRDVETLGRLARRCSQSDLDPRRLPRLYARQRGVDVVLVLLATDALVRLFSNRQPLLLPLRRLALLLLARLGWLRRLSLRLMSDGLSPTAG